MSRCRRLSDVLAEMSILQERYERATKNLHESSDHVARLEHKGSMYDRVQERCDKLEQENNHLTKQVTIQTATLKVCASTSLFCWGGAA